MTPSESRVMCRWSTMVAVIALLNHWPCLNVGKRHSMCSPRRSSLARESHRACWLCCLSTYVSCLCMWISIARQGHVVRLHPHNCADRLVKCLVQCRLSIWGSGRSTRTTFEKLRQAGHLEAPSWRVAHKKIWEAFLVAVGWRHSPRSMGPRLSTWVLRSIC